MRKVASLIAGGALLLGMAGAVFAFGQYDFFKNEGSEIYVKNSGMVDQDTTAVAKSDTGDNELSSGKIITGDALSVSGAGAYANYFTTKIIGSICGDCVKELTIKNWGSVGQDTTAVAKADTGDNEVESSYSWFYKPSSGLIVTGNAGSESMVEAWANVFTTKVGTMFGW